MSCSCGYKDKKAEKMSLTEEIDELARTHRAAREATILPCRPAPVGWEGFDNTSIK